METANPTQPIIVLITAPSKDEGRNISKVLLEKKCAACINIISPINSLYTWKGAVEDDEEVLLVVKSRLELFEDHLIPTVLEVHPYEVPEIIALPIIQGLASYLDWIDENTQVEE